MFSKQSIWNRLTECVSKCLNRRSRKDVIASEDINNPEQPNATQMAKPKNRYEKHLSRLKKGPVQDSLDIDLSILKNARTDSQKIELLDYRLKALIIQKKKLQDEIDANILSFEEDEELRKELLQKRVTLSRLKQMAEDKEELLKNKNSQRFTEDPLMLDFEAAKQENERLLMEIERVRLRNEELREMMSRERHRKLESKLKLRDESVPRLKKKRDLLVTLKRDKKLLLLSLESMVDRLSQME